jgi:hypothetical protein
MGKSDKKRNKSDKRKGDKGDKKRAVKSSLKESAKTSKDSGKNAARAAKAASADIARAEKELARTLNKLEAVREELAEREATLRGLLIRHGRMPEQQASTVQLLDQQQARTPIEEYFGENGTDDTEKTEPLFDQQQVVSHGSDEHDGGDDGHHG